MYAGAPRVVASLWQVNDTIAAQAAAQHGASVRGEIERAEHVAAARQRGDGGGLFSRERQPRKAVARHRQLAQLDAARFAGRRAVAAAAGDARIIALRAE